MTTPPERLIAFIADGEDSFVAIQIGDTTFPAVCSGRNPETVRSMERAMAALAKRLGVTIRKYEFTTRTELAAYTPAPQGAKPH